MKLFSKLSLASLLTAMLVMPVLASADPLEVAKVAGNDAAGTIYKLNNPFIGKVLGSDAGVIIRQEAVNSAVVSVLNICLGASAPSELLRIRDMGNHNVSATLFKAKPTAVTSLEYYSKAPADFGDLQGQAIIGCRIFSEPVYFNFADIKDADKKYIRVMRAHRSDSLDKVKDLQAGDIIAVPFANQRSKS